MITFTIILLGLVLLFSGIVACLSIYGVLMLAAGIVLLPFYLAIWLVKKIFDFLRWIF